jgi:hypothetical protein
MKSCARAWLNFEERTAVLVEREVQWRGDERRERPLKEARPRYPQAAIENMNSRAGGGVDHEVVTSLALG